MLYELSGMTVSFKCARSVLSVWLLNSCFYSLSVKACERYKGNKMISNIIRMKMLDLFFITTRYWRSACDQMPFSKCDHHSSPHRADIALIGLAVMGQNLIMNMNDHGFVVRWWLSCLFLQLLAVKLVPFFSFVLPSNNQTFPTGLRLQPNRFQGAWLPAEWGEGLQGDWSRVSGGHGVQAEEAQEDHPAGQGRTGCGWLHRQTGG